MVVEVQCGFKSGPCIGSDGFIEDVKGLPPLTDKIGVSHYIALTAFLGKVLPPITLECNAKCRKGKVHGKTSNLVLKEIRDLNLYQCLFHHGFDVCSIAASSLLPKGTRLPTIAHTEKGGTTVAAALLTLAYAIVRQTEYLTAVSAHKIISMMSIAASIGAKLSSCVAGSVDLKLFPTMQASSFCIVCLSATGKRAVQKLGGLGTLDSKLFAALWACLLNLVHAAISRAIHAVRAGRRKKLLAAPLTSGHLFWRTIAGTRAVDAMSGIGGLNIEYGAASGASTWHKSVATVS